MDTTTLAGKKEQLRKVEELLECDGYELLRTELERKKQEGVTQACNLKLPQSERDAGVGVRDAADYFLTYLPQLQKSLESTVKKNQGGSRNRTRE